MTEYNDAKLTSAENRTRKQNKCFNMYSDKKTAHSATLVKQKQH